MTNAFFQHRDEKAYPVQSSGHTGSVYMRDEPVAGVFVACWNEITKATDGSRTVSPEASEFILIYVGLYVI